MTPIELQAIEERLNKAAKVSPLDTWKVDEINVDERCDQWWSDFNRHQENNADDNYEPHEAEDCPDGACEIRTYVTGFLTVDDGEFSYPHPHMADFWAESGKDITALIAEVRRLDNRLALAEAALGSAHPNTVSDPEFRLKCLCIEPEIYFEWYTQVLKENPEQLDAKSND